MSVFIETRVLIKLDTDISLASATNPEIHYRKPDGSTGEWSGTIDGEYITYNTSVSDLDQKGVWWFQAVAEVSGNLVKGKIAKTIIKQPIKLT